MFKLHRKTVLVTALLFSVSAAFSSKISEKNLPLNLKSGTEFLTPNLNGPKEWSVTPGELINGRFYRILQFSQLPDEAAKVRLLAEGVQFLEYLPENAFVVSMPSSVIPIALSKENAVAAYPLETRHKLDQRLIERPLPAFAEKGNQVSVQVIAQQDLDFVSFLQNVQGFGLNIEFSKPHVKIVQGDVLIESLEELASMPWVRYVDVMPAPGEKESDDGRNLHRSNSIDSDGYGGRQYDGDGVTVAVNDDGDVGPHIDYTGRVNQSQTSPGPGTHGDMVAGIVGAAGNLDPTMRGMAPACFMWIRDYSGALPGTVPLHLSDDVLIFQSSYSNGCNVGYTALTRTVDQEIYNNPTLIQVFSGGNSNNQDCGYGAGSQWGNITGGHKMGKNVIATANLFNNDNLANSSSRGPADDGRIKPEISAHGQGQMSTDPNNAYAAGGGTSAAAPGITGCMTQLHQAHRVLNNGVTAESALLKAIMLNTANELGNIGPDFSFGFGKVNTLRALEVLEDGRYLKGTIAQNDTNSHTFTIPAGTELAKVMVYWHDKEASVNAVTALVNNLDASISNGGNTYLPYILDPTPNASTLSLPATTGVDNLNNIEQIPIQNPAAGQYTLTITGTAVPFGPQDYYVVYEFLNDTPTVTFPIGGDNLEAGTTERIHWDAYGNNGSFTLEYTTDNGSNWTTISGNVNANSRFFNWSIPNTVTGQARVRVTRNGISDESDENFSIIGVPQNLSVDYACPDTIAISWNPVVGATSYDVYVLGNKFMDSVMTVTSNQAFLTNYSINQELWISVRAETQEAKGRRAIAINKPTGLLNCVVSDDIAFQRIISPEGPHPSCHPTTALPVKFILANQGQNPVSSFDVSYSMNNGSVVTETVNMNLNPGDTIHYTMQNTVTLGPGINNFEAWASMINDGNSFNDTLRATPSAFPISTTESLPYSEDFESFTQCGTASDCGQTTCTLGNGWANGFNGLFDNIDWRTDAAGTPSNGTGPINTDANPGTAAGKYLYLEASGGCTFQEAILLSPCFDLTNSQAPQAKFSYHMRGNTVGELHVDVLSNGVWHYDVIPALIGSQGALWNDQEINLSAFVGSIATVRFRGITGSDWSSDIAIDNFSIQEATLPPTADFTGTPLATCIGQTVLLTDISVNTPNQISWDISPSTFQYVAGTNANSSQAAVEFTQAGTYDVTLIASNPNGADTVVKSAYISITNGQSLPFQNDFETAPFPSQGFTIENPDFSDTWVAAPNVTGLSGNASVTAYVNFYNYNASGEEDMLISPIIDFSRSSTVDLVFDVAYAQYSTNSMDGLRIEVSTDCGETFNQIPYNRMGPALATVQPLTSAFTPSSSAEWRRDTVDLSPYTGGSIQLRFVAVCDYGNNLYIDNINLIDNSAMLANFTSDSMVCVGDTITFFDLSQGTVSSYNWTFQNGAPANANTAGPHAVAFNAVGAQTVSLDVTGGTGSDSYSTTIEVVDNPVSDFTSSYNETTGQIDFTFTGQYAQTVTWDFGDGTTATGLNVSHLYADPTRYVVSVSVENPCGLDSTSEEVFNWPTGVENAGQLSDLKVYPNPFNGEVRIQSNSVEGEVQVSVLDLTGKRLHSRAFEGIQLSSAVTLNLNHLAQGVYLLQVQSSRGLDEVRVVKY